VLERVVKFTVEEANHKELLRVVRALTEAEALIAEDEESLVRALVLTIYDVLLVVEVDTWTDLLHVFRA